MFNNTAENINMLISLHGPIISVQEVCIVNIFVNSEFHDAYLISLLKWQEATIVPLIFTCMTISDLNYVFFIV